MSELNVLILVLQPHVDSIHVKTLELYMYTGKVVLDVSSSQQNDFSGEKIKAIPNLKNRI